MEEDSVDREELEARLYEQIYYSNHQTENNMDCNFTSPPTPSEGTTSTNVDTEVPDKNIQKSSKKHQDSENNNDKATQREKTPKKKLRIDLKMSKEAKQMLTKSQKSKQRKKARKLSHLKRLEAQKNKILKKRKELREKSNNPLKNSASVNEPSDVGITEFIYQEAEDNDDDDCLIVEDEEEEKLEHTRKKQKTSVQHEDEGKYSTESKDQKVSKDSKNDDKEAESDSDESIFEVPVPPKPPPVIVDLDSDTAQNEDKSSSEDEGANTMAVKSVEHFRVLDEIGTDSDQESGDLEVTLESQQIEEVEEESQDMILNCTPVKKGVSSLEEIKQLRKNAQAEEDRREESNVERNVVEEENCQEEIEEEPFRIMTRSQYRQQGGLKEHDFPPMNKRMQDFYNKSWGGEDFDLEKIQREMSSDPRKWAILDEDMRPRNAANRYYEVCKLCKKPGHSRKKCPNEKRRLNFKVCHMCGTDGHLETRCPQRMCLTCGKKQNTFRKTCENCRKLRCPTCNAVGHTMDHCPDNWRRFHNITTEEEWASAQAPVNVMKPKHELHCCNCAQKGHDASSCNRYRWSQHFPTPPYVSNYSSYGNLPEPELLRNPYASNRNPALPTQNTPSEPENEPAAELPAEKQPSVEQPSNQQVQLPDQQFPKPPNVRKTPLMVTEPSNDPKIVMKLFDKIRNTKSYSYAIKNKGEEWLASLRAGGCDATFLQKLRSNIPYNFEVELTKQNVVMLHIHCRASTNVEYLRNIIAAWIHRNNEERRKMILLPLQAHKSYPYFEKYVQKLCQPVREPDIIYKEMILQQKVLEKYYDDENVAQYDNLRIEMNLALVKYGLTKKAYMITQMFMKHWILFNESMGNTMLFNYIPFLHYTNILFSAYVSSSVSDKVQNYIDAKNQNQAPKEYDLKKMFGTYTSYVKRLSIEEKNQTKAKSSKNKKNKKLVKESFAGQSNPQQNSQLVENLSTGNQCSSTENQNMSMGNQNLSLEEQSMSGTDQGPPEFSRHSRWGPTNISQNQSPATNRANVIQYIQNIVEQPMPNNVAMFGPNYSPAGPWVMNGPNNFIPDAPISLLGPVPNTSTNRYGPENYMYENPANNYGVNNMNNGFVINSQSNNYMINASNNNFTVNSPDANFQNQRKNQSGRLTKQQLHDRALNLIVQLNQMKLPHLNKHVMYLHKRIASSRLCENDIKKIHIYMRKRAQKALKKSRGEK